MTTHNDIAVLRGLAQRYAEIAALPVQEEKRKMWSDHNDLKPTRVPIIASFGMWNVWAREVFCDANMKCQDPFYRQYERTLRQWIFQHEEIGDDTIQEPWIGYRVPDKKVGGGLWGIEAELYRPSGAQDGSAARYNPPLKSWDDVARLRMPRHELDEEAGQRDLDKLHSAIGGILTIDVCRMPACSWFSADISTNIAKLRGLEQLMADMYDSPKELHNLLAFMRDGIMKNQQEAEDAGHYTLTCAASQQPSYTNGLERLKPNSGPRKRKNIWGVCAAQEYELISPAFHDEFLFQYQIPIFKNYALLHYGCCENLGEKINMLRQLKNLRTIAVAPLANVRRCAEQIQRDYVLSWRPNPTDMVCCGYNEERVEKIVRKAMDDSAGCVTHINLKDVETLEGDITRLKRWVRKVRQVTEK